MVYLKKKAKKQVTFEQLKYQTQKALSKATKAAKGIYIQKLVRKLPTDEKQKVSHIENIKRCKELSHTLLGERFMKHVFGDYVAPFPDSNMMQLEEEISTSKVVIAVKADWTNKYDLLCIFYNSNLSYIWNSFRLKELNEAMSRQMRTQMSQQRAEQRNAGFSVDKYGGIRTYTDEEKAYFEENRRRPREKISKSDREKIGSGTFSSSRDSTVENVARTNTQSSKRPLEHPEQPVRRVSSYNDRIASDRNSFHQQVQQQAPSSNESLHPSWIAKQKQKEKLSTIHLPQQGKKTKFSDDDES